MRKLLVVLFCAAAAVTAGVLAVKHRAAPAAETSAAGSGGISVGAADSFGPPQYVDLPSEPAGPPFSADPIGDIIMQDIKDRQADADETAGQEPPDAVPHLLPMFAAPRAAASENIRLLMDIPVRAQPVHHRISGEYEANQRRLDAMPKPVDFAATAAKAETYCLAQNIYFESAGEPLAGMAAVGQVTLNRRDSNDFPNSICKVVRQQVVRRDRHRCQFNWYCDGHLDDPDPSSGDWKQSREIAVRLLLGEFAEAEYDIGGQTMWYHRDNKAAAGSWHERNLTYVGTIGGHRFYADRAPYAGD